MNSQYSRPRRNKTEKDTRRKGYRKRKAMIAGRGERKAEIKKTEKKKTAVKNGRRKRKDEIGKTEKKRKCHLILLS